MRGYARIPGSLSTCWGSPAEFLDDIPKSILKATHKSRRSARLGVLLGSGVLLRVVGLGRVPI